MRRALGVPTGVFLGISALTQHAGTKVAHHGEEAGVRRCGFAQHKSQIRIFRKPGGGWMLPRASADGIGSPIRAVETSLLKPRKSLGIFAPSCCVSTFTNATGGAASTLPDKNPRKESRPCARGADKRGNSQERVEFHSFSCLARSSEQCFGFSAVSAQKTEEPGPNLTSRAPLSVRT